MSNEQRLKEDDSFRREEEIQDIIDRMPTKWVQYIALFLIGLMCLFIILGFLIKYPDTVSGTISITADVAPVRLVSNNEGKIHLLKKNKCWVHEGDVIAYIESGANYTHVLLLDSLLLYDLTDSSFHISFPDTLLLGDISSAYNKHVIAHEQYKRFILSDIYVNMQQNLSNQINIDKNIVINSQKELVLQKQILQMMEAQLYKDSLLHIHDVLSEADYQSQYKNYLNVAGNYHNLQNEILTIQSSISRNQFELQRIILEKDNNLQQLCAELKTSQNALINAIQIWKKRYLEYTPIDGQLEYLGFWKENNYIDVGKELFSVIPNKSEFIGEVYVSADGAGKIKVGQFANIKLQNYPYDEYGMLKGIVSSISRQANNYAMTEKNGDAYLVIILLPDGVKTNFNKQLPVDFETKGQVDIITNPKHLIERLFDNIKSKIEK